MTRDPLTHEYAIVTEFLNGGNLRRVISEDHTKLNWNNIIQRLRDITSGLDSIHRKGYHHKDFHSGNILNIVNRSWDFSTISDFGMSRPADDKGEKKLYGVIPFVAPEVLRGEKFTKAADIYGFGMMMWEMLSGEPPFIDREYDQSLIIDICVKELRPPIPEYAPDPYVTLIKQCWSPIPTNRPTTRQIINEFWRWYLILEDDPEIKRAFSKVREDRWKARLAERARNPKPLKQSHNLFTSKRLDGM